MAVLQTLRTKAAGLLIGILGLALLAFILSDLFSSGNAFYNKFKDKAFTVDGEVVTTRAYSERIEEAEHFEKMRQNVSSLDENTLAQIRESVYQQMVKEMMLDDQAERLGLAVTQEEMNDMAYGANISPVLYSVGFFTNPQTGQFDRNVLTMFLNQINVDVENDTQMSTQQKVQILELQQVWKFIENMMKYNRLEEKYTALLSKAIMANDVEAKSVHEDSKNISDISYVVQEYSSIADSTIQVSDKDMKDLYEKRKNNFKLNTELRKISYFVKDVLPSDEDYDVVATEMAAAKEKLQNTENPAHVVSEYSSESFIDAFIAVSGLPVEVREFVQNAAVGDINGPIRNEQSYVMYKLLGKTVAPDSISLQFLPVISQNFDENITNHIADSLLSVLKKGKSFEEVAQEVAPGSNAGEAVWANELMLTSVGINKECFAASKGDVLKLSIQGQTQLVRIADKTKPVSKVKLAIIQMPVIISDKTQNAIDNELNQFITESGNSEKFETEAENKGYNLISDATIASAQSFLEQIPGSRQVIHWAFNEKNGTVKKFDLSDKRIVAIVKQDIPEGYMPMSEVKDYLETELIKDKKAEKIIKELESKNLSSLEAYAQNLDMKKDTVTFVTFQTNNISGLGYEPVFNVYSKSGQLNKMTNPLKGENGVYVLDVINRTEDTKEFDAETQKNSLLQNIAYLMKMQTTSVLMDKMKVVDNRVVFW
jgi:peptidyl-prolyl cis-trans isomerase D